MPDHGHVARRSELDALLLKQAGSVGAEVRDEAEVVGPVVDERGQVTGVRLKSGERVLADAVIATDGAYSPVKRGLKLTSDYHGYSAIALRAEMPVNGLDIDTLDIHLKLTFRGDQLPGYGWVFPLGDGRANIGLGYCTSYKDWHKIHATDLLGEFMAGLPREWDLPPVEELNKSKAL